MRKSIVVGAVVLVSLLGTMIARSRQSPSIRPVDEPSLREYAGTYRWDRDSFVYLQLWSELTGTNQLVAFDETGELRTLYPTDRDRFFAGPGAAVPAAIESLIDVQRDAAGTITSLTWSREGAPARTARRVVTERREDVRFSNGEVQLAGTLISPTTPGPHPAVILVHASGAEDREYLLPFARFLIRHGMTVLGYDKRGVGVSTGDWNKASFDDLAGDVVAAFEYLLAVTQSVLHEVRCHDGGEPDHTRHANTETVAAMARQTPRVQSRRLACPPQATHRRRIHGL
jgi:hypothetical protein